MVPKARHGAVGGPTGPRKPFLPSALAGRWPEPPAGSAPSGRRRTLTPPKASTFPRSDPQFEDPDPLLPVLRGGRAGPTGHGAPPERPFAVAVEPAGRRWRVLGYGVGPEEARRAVREIFNLDHPIEAFYRQVRGRSGALGHGADELRAKAAEGREPLRVDRPRRGRPAALGAGGRRPLPKARRGDGGVPPGRRLGASGGPGSSQARPGLGRGRDAGSRSQRGEIAGARRPRRPTLAGAFRRDRFAGWTPRPSSKRSTRSPAWGGGPRRTRPSEGSGRPDLFVAGDLGVRWALARVWGRDAPVEEDEARAWAERCTRVGGATRPSTFGGDGSSRKTALGPHWPARRVPPIRRRRTGTPRSSGAAPRTGRGRSISRPSR